MNAIQLGQRVRARRLELNINQQTLSDLSGVGINTIVSIERGVSNPSLETLQRLLSTLGLKLTIE